MGQSRSCMGTSNFADCDHLRQHSANLKAAQSHKVVKVRSIFLDTTPVDTRSLVRAIYFKEARTPLSVTDLLHYNATLGLLLDGCNNLEDVVINAPRNSGEPTARLMALLPMIPGLALKTDYDKKKVSTNSRRSNAFFKELLTTCGLCCCPKFAVLGRI